MMIRNICLPAEWEPQSLVMLTWPHQATDWKPFLKDITETYVEMVDAITKYESVVIATPHPIQVGALLSSRIDKVQMAKVYICHCKTNDTWARDHGPITLKEKSSGDNKDGHKATALTMLDFCFNGWGEKFEADLDNKITQCLHADGAFDTEENGRPRLADNNDFVLEGGAIESDGNGTIFTTEFCLTAPNRNQPLTTEEIEQELRFRLKAKRIVWLHHGRLIGDDTDGHIDTTVRLAPDNTILYNRCYDESDEQYEDFIALEEELKALRTIDGQPYRLIPLPQPKAIYDNGEQLLSSMEDGAERLPATYANFLIINNAVIVPTYAQPDRDKEACEAISKAFPNREIIPIDSRTIIRQHGSIHCCTMQVPQ
ncbi:MAG: agmatine deiminase family protein [Prevotellaceae bacterium]|nr:agmatine deiminase family protein [Prevotellaceae bacterium]